MEKRELKILDDFSSDLKSSLNLTCLLPHLMKRKLLTTSEEQKLKSQTKTDHENNSEFLDYLKTKGSRAFVLFLASLRVETEHLGHVDLYDRMSQDAQHVGIPLHNTWEVSPESLESSLSVGVGRIHSHSISEPATRRESLDSSVGSPKIVLSTTRIVDDSFTEKSQISIVQKLDKIEKAVMENSAELQRLRKECKEIKFLIRLRPSSKGSRPGSSGMEADYSSDGSEISTPLTQNTKQIKTRRRLHKHRNSWPALVSQSDSSLHSTQEEATSPRAIEETCNVLALSTATVTQTLPLLVPKKPPQRDVS